MTAQELLGWLSAPRAGRGVRIAGGADEWELREYPRIARSARRVAAALIAEGVRAGDVVCVLMPTGFEALAAFFGVWVAGATPCLISPPAFTAEQDYAAHVAAVLAQAAPRLTVTSPELAPVTARAMAEAGLDDAPWPLREADTEAAQVAPGELALLQFTSGSSGAPRGARVTWANLAANIALIKDWLDWSDGDVTASWLPLYHDMGLIGCLLTPVTAQCDLWLMRPSQFIREPLRWLECMAFARHTAAPPFALDYLARRVRPEQLAELDLSGWRNLIVGAELIDPVVLENFARLTERAGFRRNAYRTAYGLAEATLAVTAHCGEQAPHAVRPDVATLRAGKPVNIKQWYRLGEAQPTERAGWVVGCGQPRNGFTVRILDEEGRRLPEGHLGEIAVTGPSVVDGYHAGRAGGSTRFAGAELRTGDAGFQYGGELFVLGRMGDSLKVRGRSVYVEDLEAAVAQETGLAHNRFAVVSAPTAGGARVALLAESAPGAWVETARRALAARLGQDVAVTVISGRSGLIARTTSGKPRRALLSALLGSGLPDGARVLAPEREGRGGRMILSEDQLQRITEQTLEQVGAAPDWAVVLEGSIAEGFGNPSSDIDFLLIVEEDGELPTMPSILFVDGRRVEVRTRTTGQIAAQFAQLRAKAGRRVSALHEDLLNRCQRLLGSHVLRGDELVARVKEMLPAAEFAGVMTRWWSHYARQSARQAVALGALGQHEEAAAWARSALVQAVKAWAAGRGETYLEPKWLSMQLERIGDEQVAARYWALASAGSGQRYLDDCVRLVADLGVSGCTGGVGQLSVERVAGVTTWQTGDRVHVVRDKRDVFALGSAAGRLWRSIVFGRSLPDTLAAAHGVDEPGELVADFLRLGLIRLAWRGGGTVCPALPLGAPAGPISPPPSRVRPSVRLQGAEVADERAVELVPLPATRFGAAAMNLMWSNVLIENVIEDLSGAVARGQWRVAQLSAHRVVLVCARGLLSAYGVNPLPPDSEVVRGLRLLPEEVEPIRALAAAIDTSVLDSAQRARQVLAELERLVELTRTATGSLVFPSSFDSVQAWEQTLAIGYDWLRLGAYLDADLPIDEARDLLSSGGRQPHVA
ncbi:hypothetical protein GCM10010174_49290 [Kutzneria viridogrisea]|uniref:Acyl-CoA synthetase (AMP-forming)/AMP-acid ligase II/alkylhydroperoxidase family enzyme n=1 Tax=Kutzneria viridogrisea TaxID=47990 RepID=A0ABR6B8V8_9PSEU|nr:acyl-CoA synthetase (AMP-forming)/AMP-acid ligase II/alkylhydroperoxidase family enzyme [Kutzneria viridogrisea]